MSEIALYMFYQTVSNLWSSLLCGNQTKKQKELFEIMSTPKNGDFVMENTSGFLAARAWRSGDKEAAINYIKSMMGTLEETTIDENGMKVWHIKNLHGEKQTWDNASFLTVPSYP